MFGLNCFQYGDHSGTAEITHQLWIKASPERVFNAVTQQEGLAQWWISRVEAKPEIGYINLFYEGSDVIPMQVVCLQPHTYVAWRCLLEGDEWYNTIISFEIREKNGVMILNFKQSGWPAQNEYFSICNFHWARHLLKLKHYCETGKGLLNTTATDNWGELSTLLT